MLKDLITKTRSYRRFKQEPAPTMADLESLITLARMAPAASNKQPWKYVLVQDPETLPKVFSCLKWAGYLTDWPGPSPQERPTAYIVFLNDTSISENGEIHLVDLGLAAQNIILGARELGFGACLLGSVDRPRLAEILDVPQGLKIELVAALGAPGERVELTSSGRDGDIRYWRGEDDVHYVPKRPLEELIFKKI
ncbi:MAG: nitroreductase family protein [Limnochordia bacterium]|nr:nitroreductase family protein [Bacillota bacterium]NLL08793.1 nitroreductase family protein [Bacillota bacterium]HBG09491.1 nitroreductase [Bacillota bacterium]